MARRTLLAAVLTGAVLALPCAANAAVASTTAVIQDISAQFVGQPGYAGMHTFAVWVLFQTSGDRLLSTSNWNVSSPPTGCFFNADPVADDPLGLIDDSSGGDVPIAPSILSQRGYQAWAWDTNLSIDNNPQSQVEPLTVVSATHMQGGAFVPPPGTAAGLDLMVRVAQITVPPGGQCFNGTLSVTHQSASSQQVQTRTIHLFGCLSFIYPLGDLNGDLLVNTLDLGILLSSWSLPTGSPGCGGDLCCHSDINGDGQVNSLDLGILLVNWTEF